MNKFTNFPSFTFSLSLSVPACPDFLLEIFSGISSSGYYSLGRGSWFSVLTQTTPPIYRVSQGWLLNEPFIWVR